MSIYQQLKSAGCEISNHHSDLYVVVDDTSRAIVDEWRDQGNSVSLFKDNTTGKLTFDLPFQYKPYWEAVSRASARRAGK